MSGNSSQAAPALCQGTVVAGRYTIEGLLGEGAFGEVYLATNDLGGKVVVKILKPSFSNRADVVRRFLKEPRAAASVSSPHVVQVSDAGTMMEDGSVLKELPLDFFMASQDGRPKPRALYHFIVMEYLQGNDLAKEFEGAPLPLERVLYIVSVICDGLSDVHAAGIVHRDLKPENVFLVKNTRGKLNGAVKIMDFGIAGGADDPARSRLTRTGSTMGTPNYMAPEQWKNPTGVDHRADIYALGVMLYEMVEGGYFPFDGETETALLMASVMNPPRPMLVADEALQSIVLKAIAVDPAKRFQSASEMTAALEDYAKTQSIFPGLASQPPAEIPAPATIAPPPPRPQAETGLAFTSDVKTPPRRTRRGGIIAVGAAALLIATIAFAALGGHKAPPTRVVTNNVTTATPPVTSVTPTVVAVPATDANTVHPVVRAETPVSTPTPTNDPPVAPVAETEPSAQTPTAPLPAPAESPPRHGRRDQRTPREERNGHAPIAIAPPHCVDARYTYTTTSNGANQCCRTRHSGAIDCDGEIAP